MWKRFSIFVLASSIFIFTGCSSSQNETPLNKPEEQSATINNNQDNQQHENKNEDIKTDPKENTDTANNSDPKENTDTANNSDINTMNIVNNVDSTVDTTKIQTTPLFDDVFLKLYKGVTTSSFESVKEFVSNLDYTIEITEPTLDDMGKILISDNNNNSIFIGFYPNPEVETIYSIEYTQQELNKSIRVTDSFHTAPGFMEIHNIGSPAIKVDNIDELKTFMFTVE